MNISINDFRISIFCFLGQKKGQMFLLTPQSAVDYADILDCVAWDVMIFHLQSMQPLQSEFVYLLSRLVLSEIRTRIICCEDVCARIPWRVASFMFGSRLCMNLRRLKNIKNKKIKKETSKTLKKASGLHSMFCL